MASQHPEEDFVSAVQHLVGRRVQVCLFDGTKYMGLFHSASSKNGIVLKDPLLVEGTSLPVFVEGWNNMLPEYLRINPNNISHLGEEPAAANGNSASNYHFLPDDIYLTRAEILNDMSSWNLNPDAPSFVPRREYQILAGTATAHTVASWPLNEIISWNLNPDAPSFVPRREYQILAGTATARTVAFWPLNEIISWNLNPDAPSFVPRREYQILLGLATAHTVASWFLNETSSWNLNPDAPSFVPRREFQILPGLATAHTVASWPLNETRRYSEDSSSNLSPVARSFFPSRGNVRWPAVVPSVPVDSQVNQSRLQICEDKNAGNNDGSSSSKTQ